MLVGHDFVDQVGQLGGGRNRHTTQKHLRIEVTVGGAGIVQVGDFIGSGTRLAACHISLVAHDDDESRGIVAVTVADERLDARSARTCVVGSINCGVDTFLFLPNDPVLECGVASISRGGDDNHLDRGGVKVGVVGIDIQHSTAIEHLGIDDIEIRAVGADKHVFSSLGIGTIEMNFHLNVIENAHCVVDGVVADGFDTHLADLDATHDAIHVDGSTGR